MMSCKPKKKILLWCVLFLASIYAIVHPLMAQEMPTILEELQLFSKAMAVILEGYVDDRQPRALFYDAVKGMMSSLDQYSAFITKEQFGLLKISMKGEYSGIGARLEAVEGLPVIMELRPGSAAEKAGLLVQDRIMKVDGVPMLNKALADVSALLRGEENTALLLNVKRPATNKLFDVKIVREKVIIEMVKDVRMIGKALGYMRITEFSDITADQVRDGLKLLRKQGMRALVLDLRNNQGGVMTEAVELAEAFLPAGKKIVTVKSKIPEQRKDYVSVSTSVEPNYPILIIVNEFSASAAEIFTAAMQENGRAKVIGMKTYGKASVQSVVPLDDVTAMKFTTARYVTPKGKVIDHVGIVPDEQVQNGPEGTPAADRQTQRALELLRKYM